MSSRILYIEDDEQNFYLVSYILRARGHEVVWARDGKTGIDVALREPADLILLDIQLPVMDGYAVARALRAYPSLASTPIVAVTSYAMAGDRERTLEAGCTGYIEKPIDPVTFAGEVEGFLAPGAGKGASS